ncbi:hypothetical protein WJX81_007638 [Elliptochloris bilobata]|uniref:VOC domain-containing protein n=1 Tax=Elliptochloris bilobata TaxID=381761 RepID=A0AAW1SD11_9CHLO
MHAETAGRLTTRTCRASQPQRVPRPLCVTPRCLFRATRRSASAGTQQTAKSVAGAELLSSVTKDLKNGAEGSLVIHGVHHVGLLIADLERSLKFYRDVLGLEVNSCRPNNKLPYRGTWLQIGHDQIHLMELPNPDPTDVEQRPQHGGRDRHFCVGVESVAPLAARLEAAGIPFTRSMSGRAAIFFRDPDANVLEVAEVKPWR